MYVNSVSSRSGFSRLLNELHSSSPYEYESFLMSSAFNECILAFIKFNISM